MLAIPTDPQALREYAQQHIAEVRTLNKRLAPKTARISPQEVARLREEAAASVPSATAPAPQPRRSLTRRLWALAVIAMGMEAAR